MCGRGEGTALSIATQAAQNPVKVYTQMYSITVYVHIGVLCLDTYSFLHQLQKREKLPIKSLVEVRGALIISCKIYDQKTHLTAFMVVKKQRK